jgi:hypothetical protein
VKGDAGREEGTAAFLLGVSVAKISETEIYHVAGIENRYRYMINETSC